MPNVQVIQPHPEPVWVSIAEMKPGQFGRTGDGALFYRTSQTAACLTDPSDGYLNALHASHLQVKLEPPGTKIVIEVTE